MLIRIPLRGASGCLAVDAEVKFRFPIEVDVFRLLSSYGLLFEGLVGSSPYCGDLFLRRINLFETFYSQTIFTIRRLTILIDSILCGLKHLFLFQKLLYL
ncbi:hypothetical protein TNCT_637221 [Trichonephila clavata]|uniref:Uncharacterized protein n=1 Tax=Trichonephila clavata TaxID=2740835 RepID=A0A8X6GAJ8_TRICU|nr:hypothetical protein TNCT_637221 [Trichonephila clavata]